MNVTKKIFATLLLISVSLPAAAFAGEPQNYVKAKSDAVNKLFLSPDVNSRGKAIEKLFEETIDLEELAAKSLGEEWTKRTPEQQKDFVVHLKQLLRANYDFKVGNRKFKKSDYVVKFNEEKERGNRAVVKTMVTSDGKTVPVNYRLLKKGKVWVIYDLILDGVSLVETYEESYKEIIKKDGWEELMKLIEKKTKELEEKAKGKK